MKIDYDVLVEIMDYIKELDYPKSKQVQSFIEDIKEHFGDVREGS